MPGAWELEDWFRVWKDPKPIQIVRTDILSFPSQLAIGKATIIHMHSMAMRHNKAQEIKESSSRSFAMRTSTDSVRGTFFYSILYMYIHSTRYTKIYKKYKKFILNFMRLKKVLHTRIRSNQINREKQTKKENDDDLMPLCIGHLHSVQIKYVYGWYEIHTQPNAEDFAFCICI